MKKNNFTLIIFLVTGLLLGTIFSQLVSNVPWLSFLSKSAEINWQPRADLQVIQYDLQFTVRLNLASILGLAAAFLMYRKL